MQNKSLPLVSVVCLSYNHEKFIERCLISVANQTFTEFEVIFIDNDSSDNSFEVGMLTLKKFQVKYHAIKMDSNLGIAGGINHAIKNFATGKYIAAIASDDFWDIYNLDEKVRYFEQHQEYGMLYGNGYNYNDASKEITLYYKKPSISGWILRDLLKAHPINPQGILYRHDVLKELNFFDENAKVEDREIFYRIARKYQIGYLHIPLTFYRVSHGNISSNLSYMKEGNEYFFKKYEKEFPKEIKLARIKQDCFFAYSISNKDPSFSSLMKIMKNYHFSWLYTKEVIRCILNIVKS